MKGKNVFVSGGAGVIGSVLVEKLLEAGANLFVGDLKPCPSAWKGLVRYRQGDLNYISKEELLDFAPEFFFHLAATFERSTEEYPFFNENFQHNVQLSHYLMGCLKDCAALKKVIFASSYLIYDPTTYIFSEPQEEPVDLKENSLISPRNICGASKLFHEMELRFLEQFSSADFVSARIFRGYGRNSRDVISRWIRQAQKGEKISVYCPEGIFDYIYADDTAEGLLRLAKSDFTGVINLGTGKGRRVSEIVEILREHSPLLKVEQSSVLIPYEASQANMQKWKQVIGWMPQETLETAIPRIIEFEKERTSASDKENEGVLITSISKKIPLIEAVRYGAQKLGAFKRVYGCDLNAGCLGKYIVDGFWQSPNDDSLTVEDLIERCQKHHITAIVPTRDRELLFYAKHRSTFENAGIHVLISDESCVQLCLDKMAFAEFLKQKGLPIIQTEIKVENVHAHKYVVKERWGAGSVDVGINLSKDEAIDYAKKLKEPIFQPYINGKEYSIDLYRDKQKKVKGIVVRCRDLIVNGESQITTTMRYPELEELGVAIANHVDIFGHAVIQVIETTPKVFHILECNPRFGGASTASITVGLDSFYWFFLECLGESLDDYSFQRKSGEIRQVRVPQDKALPWS